MSCQQQLLPGSLQIYDADTIISPCVNILFHLEVKAGATEVGSCHKEFEDILPFPLQDIKGSGHCKRFPLLWQEHRTIPQTPLWEHGKDSNYSNCCVPGTRNEQEKSMLSMEE